MAWIKLDCLRKLQQLCRLFCKNVSFKIFKQVGRPYVQPSWAAGWTPLVRQTLHADLNCGAFHYEANYNYTLHPSVVIRKMDNLCMYYSALKFKNETPGMCCTGRKVKLQKLDPTPEQISNLVSCGTSQSKYFLANILKYNYKVQGQIYHHSRSPLPLPDTDH